MRPLQEPRKLAEHPATDVRPRLVLALSDAPKAWLGNGPLYLEPRHARLASTNTGGSTPCRTKP